MSPTRRRILRLALVACLAGVLPAAAARAEAPQEARVPSLAVLPARLPTLLASVDGGVRHWLADRIAASGVPVLDVQAVGAAVAKLGPPDRVWRGADATALSQATGARWLLYTDLRYEAGQADLRLRVHDGATGALLAGVRREGKLGELGESLRDALADVVTTLGQPADAVRNSAAPSLAELSAETRALAALERGALVEAWQELAAHRSDVADAVRAAIVRRSASAPPAQRSRLASLRGVSDNDWLVVRQGLADGRDPAVLLAGADAAIARSEPDRALRLYEQVAALDPREPAAQIGRARLLDAAGRHEEALKAWRQAEALEPDAPEIQEALAASPVLPPAERAQRFVQAGSLRADRLEVGAATRAFDAAARTDGGVLALARRNVGLMNERMGSYGEALLSYEEAAALAEDDPELMAGLGRARFQVGDPKGAEQAFDQALRADPGHGEANLGLGRVLTEEGRAAEAIPHLERAVAVAPHDGRVRRDLARARAESGDLDGALRDLDPSDVGDPIQSAAMQADAAGLLESAGRVEDARVALERAMAIEPEDPPLHTALAGLYEVSGDAAGAAQQRALAGQLAGIAPTGGEGGRGAEAALSVSGTDLAVLLSSFPNTFPGTRKPLGKVLYLGVEQVGDHNFQLVRWLHPKQIDTAVVDDALIHALLEHFALVSPPDVPDAARSALARVRDFSTARDDIALVNDVLGVDAVFVARLVPEVEGGRFPLPGRPLSLELRLLGGRSTDDVFILANKLTLREPTAWVRWNPRAAGCYAVLLALLMLPVMRGWGGMVVELEYQERQGSKGFFSIELSRRPTKARREKTGADGVGRLKKYQRKERAWSRKSRHMVGRKTTFRFIPAGTWYVAVHGLLQDVANSEVIGNYLEERKVQLPRGETLQVGFDFRPKEATLEVRIVREEGRENEQVVVALRGRPDSIRYVREEKTLYYLGNGEHVVVVGHGDRVFEQQLMISELGNASVAFRLADLDMALFADCPDAVEPYLLGDLLRASEALALAGQDEIAARLRAEYHELRGDKREAARQYQAAGDLTSAAELAADSDDAAGSATLFEQAGDFGKAGERYAAAGDFMAAARAFEAAYDFDAAIDAYRSAEAWTKAMELLERTGRYYEAASIAVAQDDADRAIRNLQMVDLRDPDYAEACSSLAQIFADREEWSLAVQKAEEAVGVAGEAGAPLELHEQLARVLERAGNLEAALEVYESIRKRDFSYPEVKQRIEALRTQLGAAKTMAAGQGATEVRAAAPAPATAPAPGEDRYEILAEVGRGGMGIVFKARDRRLGRVVALKRLPDNLRDHPTAVELFLREARAAAALNHPNIVTLFDADQSAGNYYITMEFLEGLPLDAILRKRTRLSARDALRLAVQISTGLQYAHEQRIVHRDIKTSNLFFTRDKVVKIMDFGLAKMLEEVRRAATVIGGTPYYMAPEQAAGEPVDHRADLYAFGVTLFEMVTGGVPFTEGDVTYHHRHTPAPDPRERQADVPDDVAMMILWLMAKSPDERPATTAEVTAALSRMLQQASGA